MGATTCDWLASLPFSEVWCIDFEYYPGRGLASGGVDGDPVTPLCLVAYEVRSGRTVRLWQDELGHFPPYRLDAGALIISYGLAAEFSCHLRLGWGEPARAIDALIEFRHYTNDGRDRDRGLGGALSFFKLDSLDTAHKKSMRDRILRGPPFTVQERAEILAYCEDDVKALVRLLPRLLPTIRSWRHALHRGRVQWAIAKIEARGLPFDLPSLLRLRRHWDGMRTNMVSMLDPFGVYEITDGVAHWRMERFESFVAHHRLSWPRLASGQLCTDDETFREMATLYPAVNPLRELRCSLSKLKLNALAVGGDARNRTPLWAYCTKTARCAPSTTKYAFGPAKWLRFIVVPPSGLALIHRDYQQQEVRIAALLSGDDALLAACESGDVYFGIAEQIGLLRGGMSDEERAAVRDLSKIIVLSIQYGAGAHSLAVRTGMTRSEAHEILARLRARFHRFQDFVYSVGDHAGLDLEISTCFDWRLKCPSGSNPRTARNFPAQSAGAMILHTACLLAERRGIEIVAPIHDAFVAQCGGRDVEDASAALDRVMRDASAIVLRGYELPTDKQIIKAGERYFDKRGAAMWETVSGLLAKRERETA
jgi:DNA polymerase family A